METQFPEARERSYRQATGLFNGVAELPEESAAESVVRKDAVIYVRLPSDEGGMGASLTDQIDACSLLCAERSWNIADVVVDEAVRTAADPHGINLALYGQADVVVVHDLAVLTSSTNLLL